MVQQCRCSWRVESIAATAIGTGIGVCVGVGIDIDIGTSIRAGILNLAQIEVLVLPH